MFNNALSLSNALQIMLQHRLFQLAKDLHIPSSPLLLTQFTAFTKTKSMNTDFIFRILFFASKLGLSLARPLRASQNVNSIPIHTLFENNPTAYGKYLHMIKRSNIQHLHQCTSVDGTILLPYREAFSRNSSANPGTKVPKWYKHLANTVTGGNSWRLLDTYIRTHSPQTNIASTSIQPPPLQKAPVPRKESRAAYWCALWDNSSNSPIFGKAIYSSPSILRLQHWIPIYNTTIATQQSLTPTSRRLQLKECTGCYLNTDVIVSSNRNNGYFDQFPCRIPCQHNEAVKLTISSSPRFDRHLELAFNTTLAKLTSDIRSSFFPHTINTSAMLTPFDRGTTQLALKHNDISYNIITDTRTAIKNIFDAVNFNGLLQLARWNNIKNLSDNSSIDWVRTWNFFGHHMNAKKTTTSYKHSIQVSFRTKLMMNELPLLNNLVRRHPDLYKQDWKCALCDQEQETWVHLWRCSHLTPRISALIQETKRGFKDLLSEFRPNLPSSFDNTWNSLNCWSLADANTHANTFTFDLLIKGFIPTALTAAITTVVTKKEAEIIINNVTGVAQTLFKDEVWSYRCQIFNEWEIRKGITDNMKKSSSSGSSRSRALNNNHLLTTPSATDRWKSWIAQEIDTGRPWLGFQIHINSLVSSLVQHPFKI